MARQRRFLNICYLSSKYLAFLLIAGTCCSVALATDARVEVSSNRDKIYIGESIVLTVKVSGLKDPPMPDLSGIKKASVRFRNSQSQNYRHMTIINGRMQTESFFGRTFTYEVIPAETGSFIAGPVTVNADGRTISSSGPGILVSDIEKQDRVIVHIIPSRENVLVDESFDITLAIALKRLPGDRANVEPLAAEYPLHISAPYLDGAEISGLEMPDIIGFLQKHLSSTQNAPGFSINEYTSQQDLFSINSFFDSRDPLERRRAKFVLDKRYAQYDGQSYIEYFMTLSYKPKKEGSYTFGPCVVKGNTIARVNNSGRGVMEPVFTIGPACTVLVVPPPEEGRPESYIGAIGSELKVDASLDSQTCNVGDPLKLTLTVGGAISLDNLRPPRLGLIEALTENFRVYDDSVKTISADAARKFVYTVRPIKAGTIEVPGIDVGYYDINTRQYHIEQSAPIPVRANEAAEVADSMLIDTVLNRNGDASGISTDVPAPLDMNPDGAVPASVTGNPRIFWWLLFGPVLYVSVLTTRQLRKHLLRNSEKTRCTTLVRSSYSTLKRAEKETGISVREAAGMVCEALRCYMAGRFAVKQAGITPAELSTTLLANGIDADTAKQLHVIMRRNFDLSYNPGKTDHAQVREDCRNAAALLKGMDRSLRRRWAPRHTAVSIALLFFLLSTASHSAPTQRFDFIWQQANAQMIQAREPHDFMDAAYTYQSLINEGVRNGPLFYNFGTALLKAERYSEARKALLISEAYTGTTPDVVQNLQLAMKGLTGEDTAVLAWSRYPLFWHYGIATSVRAIIAVWSFTMIWLGLTLRAVGFKNTGQSLAILALIVFVLFGSSVATSIHQSQINTPYLTRNMS